MMCLLIELYNWLLFVCCCYFTLSSENLVPKEKIVSAEDLFV